MEQNFLNMMSIVFTTFIDRIFLLCRSVEQKLKFKIDINKIHT